jgi:hypothetical protein
MDNVEKSAFNRGEYVGYGGGLVWRIVKSNSSFGNWQARPVAGHDNDPRTMNTILYAFRLRDMATKIKAAR